MPEISEADLQSLNDSKTELDTVKGTVDGLKSEMDGLKVGKADLERKLGDADSELLSEEYLDFKAGKGKPKVSDNEDDGEFDFDRASGKEIAAHLKGSSKKELEEAIRGVTDRIGKTEEQMGKAFAQLDVTLTALRHTDFDENKEAIYKVAKSNRGWGAERCYKQWKMEHKTEIDAKAKEKEEKEIEARKALSERGEEVAGSGTQKKELGKDDAASLAYDQSFGNAEKA